MASYLNVVTHGGNAKAAQMGKTLPVTTGEAIKRGSLMKIVSGAFSLAVAADGLANVEPGDLYISLHEPGLDLDAGAAGAYGDGSSPTETNFGAIGVNGAISGSPALAASGYKVTGIPLSAGLEIQTDQFNGTPAVGAYLVPDAAGKVKTHTATEDTAMLAVGIVTVAAANKSLNGQASVAGYSTGFALVSVLTYRMVYIPNVVVLNAS